MIKTPPPIRFGFLPVDWEIEFEAGKIVPIPEFVKIAKSVKKRLNKDGYLYPPTVKTVRAGLEGKKDRTIPKTKRPAHLHPVPPSHDLFITPANPEPNLREGSAGFVIHFLAFVCRTRLQFAEWYFDGRIPIERQRGIGEIVSNRYQAGRYLSVAYKIWSGWPEPEQRRFTNILYMFSRAPAYQWDWEEFVIEYMVLDACWKMGKELFGFPSVSHAGRPKQLCDKFGIAYAGHIDFDDMVKLRNDLFHETLWHKSRPGSTIGKLPYHMPTRMWWLNEQIIASFMQLP